MSRIPLITNVDSTIHVTMDEDVTNISDDENANGSFMQMRDMDFQFDKSREARPGTKRSTQKLETSGTDI